jgi:hypothetical protein
MNNASMVDDNHGFYKLHGGNFHAADFPTATPAIPPVDQLLGINDSDVTVGFWTDNAATVMATSTTSKLASTAR